MALIPVLIACCMLPVAAFTLFCFWQASGLLFRIAVFGVLILGILTVNIAVIIIAGGILYFTR